MYFISLHVMLGNTFEILKKWNEAFLRFDFERFDFRMAIELYSKMEVVFKTGEYNL